MIDADVHCAPASYRALYPYLSEYWRHYIEEAGVRLTAVEHAYPRGAPTSASPAAREQRGGPVPASYEALREAVLEPRSQRAAPLGAGRPSTPRHVVLNCLTGFETHRNPYFTAAVASALNDWLREEFLARDERLRASLVVSPISTDDAVAEIERVGDDRRFVQVLLPARADLPWGNKNNHRIFAAAREHRLQVAVHAWGRAGKAPTPSGFTTTYLEDYIANQPIAQAQVLSLVAEGVFDRFPELRVVLVECGFAWLPPLLWRFDKDWKGVWREVPWLKRLPSEYVIEHLRFTTAPAHLPDDADAIAQLLEMLPAGKLLTYASDYPHDHGDGLGALLEQLGEEDRKAVLEGNAAALYGLG